jgi:hypothetical protein
MRSNENLTILNRYYTNLTLLKTQMKPKFGFIKAAAVLMGSMILFACGGSGSSGAGSSAGLALTKSDLIGNWVGCIVTGTFSTELYVTFNEGGSATSTLTQVPFNTNCSKADGQETAGDPSTDSFKLGALLPDKTVTVDGVVITLTNVTEIDLTNTTVGAEEEGQVEYNIIGIQDGAKLFIGDLTGEQDGSTDALRPTTIAPLPFVKTVDL